MHKLLRWWFLFTTPTLDMETATPARREQQRYARLINGFALLILTMIVLTMPVTLASQSLIIAFSTTATAILQIAAVVCVKNQRTVLGGLCSVLSILIALSSPILSAPISSEVQISLLNSLVIAILFAGALLPPRAVFSVAAITCLITIYSMTYQEHTSNMDPLFRENLLALLIPTLVLQIVVAVVIFVIIRSLLITIRRADRAEEIAKFQKMLAENEHARAEELKNLEAAIKDIEWVHMQVAKGNLQARASLAQGNVLWSIAGSLNNLLSRAQQWKRDADILANWQAQRNIHPDQSNQIRNPETPQSRPLQPPYSR